MTPKNALVSFFNLFVCISQLLFSGIYVASHLQFSETEVCARGESQKSLEAIHERFDQ